MELKKRGSTNLLILNQLTFDFFSCLFLVVAYAVKIRNCYLTGWSGYLLCQFIESELLWGIGVNGSVARIVFITLDRYAKLVFPLVHKKYFRNWMVYVGIATSWLNGVLVNLPASLLTTVVEDGECLKYFQWPSSSCSTAYGVWFFFWEFLLPLGIFVYCYSHILIVIRKRTKVFVGNNADMTTSSTVQASTLRSQMNVIKTMITIIICLALSWLPNSTSISSSTFSTSSMSIFYRAPTTQLSSTYS